MGLYLLIWLTVNIWLRIENNALVLSSAKDSDEIAGVLVVLAFLAIGLLINYFRNKLFPRMVFLIGQEIKRHGTLEKVQWVVVLGFMVSFFSGLALLIIF